MNRQTMIMIFLMTVMMGLIMSAWFTWQISGLTFDFISNWATRFVSTYIVVLPTVLLVSPIAQRLSKVFAGSTTLAKTIALDAWHHNARGHAGESFVPWLKTLAPNVVISMPLGAFRGEIHGTAKAQEIYGAIAAASPRLTYEKPLRVTEAGDTVMIEFNDYGTIAGYPYKNRIAASFDIKNGKVAAYREYFGDIDPAVVAMMTSASTAPRAESHSNSNAKET